MVSAAPPLDTSRDYTEVQTPTEEEQARQLLVDNLWLTKKQLDLARRNFEEREDQRAKEYQANAVAAENGDPTTNGAPEAFDVRWVVRYRELTRHLIDAEAAYANAKRSALEAGIPLPFPNNESVCGDLGEATGYTISVERDMVTFVPSPTVRRWLSAVPEGIEVGSVGEEMQDGDELEADEVGISDSVSLVAEGRERARIDRWRNACEKRK